MKTIILSLVLLCSVNSQASVIKDLSLLEKFYTVTHTDRDSVTYEDLSKTMKSFEGSLAGSDQTAFIKMEKTLLSFKPLLTNDGTAMFAQNVEYSYFQNQFIVKMENFVEGLHSQYGKTGEGFFTHAEFLSMFTTINNEILFKMGILDPTVPNFAEKLFHDMNLYTFASDGDDQVSFAEFINFAMLYSSAGTMKTKIMNNVIPVCDQNLGTDIMGATLIPAPCFRNEFMNKIEMYLDTFPSLKLYFSTLNAQNKHAVLTWLEHSARRDGFSEENVGSYDYFAIPMMLHKVETLMSRFDLDNSAFLTKAELLNMSPVFNLMISKKAKIDLDQKAVLDGIFTYMFKYEQMPNLGAKFTWWLNTYKLPTTKIYADQGSVMNFMCLMAAPENAKGDQDKINAQICQ